MLTDVLNKNNKVMPEDDKDAELQKLREQVSTLKKKTGIDDLALETEKIRQENEARMQQALEEEKKKREENAERKKKERAEQIQQIFKEQLNKKIKVFIIESDASGRRAKFQEKTPIGCPYCGFGEINSLIRESIPQAVMVYEDIQKDPVILLEKPYISVHAREHHCPKCKRHFTLNFQITL